MDNYKTLCKGIKTVKSAKHFPADRQQEQLKHTCQLLCASLCLSLCLSVYVSVSLHICRLQGRQFSFTRTLETHTHTHTHTLKHMYG